MRMGIYSAQAYAKDNKPNFPGLLPSRLFIIVVSILSSPLISYRYQDKKVLYTFIQSFENIVQVMVQSNNFNYSSATT